MNAAAVGRLYGTELLDVLGDQPTTPDVPPPGDQDCPTGSWDVWGDNCLLVRPNDYRSWDEALE